MTDSEKIKMLCGILHDVITVLQNVGITNVYEKSLENFREKLREIGEYPEDK